MATQSTESDLETKLRQCLSTKPNTSARDLVKELDKKYTKKEINSLLYTWKKNKAANCTTGSVPLWSLSNKDEVVEKVQEQGEKVTAETTQPKVSTQKEEPVIQKDQEKDREEDVLALIETFNNKLQKYSLMKILLELESEENKAKYEDKLQEMIDIINFFSPIMAHLEIPIGECCRV